MRSSAPVVVADCNRLGKLRRDNEVVVLPSSFIALYEFRLLGNVTFVTCLGQSNHLKPNYSYQPKLLAVLHFITVFS